MLDAWMHVQFRLELNCGSNIPQPKTKGILSPKPTLDEAMQGQQCVVDRAKSMGVEGYRSDSQEHGDLFTDAYLYPRYSQLDAILQITNDCGWEGDILDVPTIGTDRNKRRNM